MEASVKADAVPLLDLFEKKMRLEVPLFQRQYVWSREQQWEPLWEDVSRKCAEFIEGRSDGPVHRSSSRASKSALPGRSATTRSSSARCPGGAA